MAAQQPAQEAQQDLAPTDIPIEGMRAIVTGATGQTGRRVVQWLASAPQVAHVGAVVRSEKADAVDFWSLGENAGKVEQVVVDYEKLEDSRDKFQNYTHGFCCLGTTRSVAGSAAAFRRVDLDYVKESSQLMKDGGVRHFLLQSSMGAKRDSWSLYPKTKGEAEHEILGLGFDKVSIFRPGILFDRNDKSRLFEYVAARVMPSFLGIKLDPLSQVMVALATGEKQQPERVRILENGDIRKLQPESASADAE